MSAATYSRWFLASVFLYLKVEAIRSSETSVHTRSTRHHIQEDGILHLSFTHFTFKIIFLATNIGNSRSR
jgi:predicted MPP superfamily phosphohydrolase